LRSARLYTQIVGNGLHRKLRSLAELLPISDANMSWDFKIRRGLLGLSYPPAAWNPAWMAPVEPRLLGEFFSEPLSLEEVYAEAIDLWNTGNKRNPVDRTLEFFTNLYLPDDILTKTDRATMMSSLESRAIFLDNDLVAFCQRLPHHFKYRNGTRKYLLKQALKPWLPSDIIDRPKKGFGIPLAKWLRTFPEQLPQRSIAGMNSRAVSRAFEEHRTGKADHRLMLWCWLSLQEIIAPRQPAMASV
jgi:asparagine synthase (glutamine-hydrolysing)